MAETNPITVKASINDGEKHVLLVIEDIAQIAAIVASVSGHSEVGQGIVALSGLAETALAGYEDAAMVEITPETITSLLPDQTPLALPIDGKPNPVGTEVGTGSPEGSTEAKDNETK